MKEALLRRIQVLVSVLGQLWRAPLGTLLTVAVIGISLAFPAGLYLAVQNAQQLAGRWDGSSDISLFLKSSIGENDARALAREVQKSTDIARVEIISREAALAEFKRYSGFGEALDQLGTNPLPVVLIVQPSKDARDATKLTALVKRLEADPRVDTAQLDVEWVQRLEALLAIAQRLVLILASLLAVAIVLIIGNTIRLAVLNRRDEIEITKLIGGTAPFIRRPFLYSGMIQGGLGGAMAWLLVGLALAFLDGPLSRLGGLYGHAITVEGLGLRAGMGLLLAGAVLGWLGSRLAVGRHLREIEPDKSSV